MDVALASVLVSGFVGVFGLALATWTAVSQRRHDARWKMREERRAAYVDFLTAARALDDAVLRYSLLGPHTAEDRDALLGAMGALLRCKYGVEIVAPDALRDLTRTAAAELASRSQKALRGERRLGEAGHLDPLIAAMSADLGHRDQRAG